MEEKTLVSNAKPLRLVSQSFSRSFYLFPLSIPSASSLIPHLALCVPELRANYTFWVYDAYSFTFPVRACVFVCAVRLYHPEGRIDSCLGYKVLVNCIIYLLMWML